MEVGGGGGGGVGVLLELRFECGGAVLCGGFGGGALGGLLVELLLEAVDPAPTRAASSVEVARAS